MRLKQKISGIVLGAALLAPLLPVQAWAGTGVIYITPAASSLQTGASETLSLRISPGTTVDGVQATVSYNPGLLQINSVDTSGSPFSAPLQKSYGGGTITVSLGSLSGGVSSDALIATMNFTAVSSGSAALTVSNANATSGGAYTNPAVSGATINVSAPVSSAPVSGGGGGGTGSSGGSTHSSGGTSRTSTGSATTSSAAPAGQPGAAPPPAMVTPVQLKSKLSSSSYTSATLQVTSNQALNIRAEYGTAPDKLSAWTDTASGVTKADLTLANLTPGTVYYYQVIGEDGTGAAPTTLAMQHFTTPGFTLRVTVLDEQNHVLPHHKVTLHSRTQTATTDAHGVATFTGVAPGVHHVEYALDGKTYSQPVYVENNVPKSAAGSPELAAVQTAAVVLPVQAPPASGSLVLIVGLVSCLLAIAVATAFELVRHHQNEMKRAALKLASAGRAFLA